MNTGIRSHLVATLAAVLLLSPSIPARVGSFSFIGVGALGSDFNDDGIVGFADFLLFVENYKLASTDPGFDGRYDLDGDGRVGFSDFLSFSTQYGQAVVQPAASPYEVYVVDFGDNSVAGFDYNSHLIVDFLPFRGPTSLRVSRDHETIYISEQFGFFALDTDHDVRFSVPTSGSGRIALSADGSTAFLAEQSGSRLQVIDLEAEAPVDSLALPVPPTDIALSADGEVIYLPSQFSQTVTVATRNPLQIIGTVQTGASPGEVLATPDGSKVYVSHVDDGSIAVIDGQTHQVLGLIQLDGQNSSLGLAFSPDAGTLYITASASIMALDTQRNLILDSLLLGDATSTLGVSPDGKRAYVGTLVSQEGGPGITVVDLEAFAILGRMRGFSFPLQMGFRRLGGAE